MRFQAAFAMALLITAGSSDARAWGCEGHRAVVFIAERLLPPATLVKARAALLAAPIDPALSRFCDPVPDDPLVDSATWADDYRAVDASTFDWHFIDLPRGLGTLTASNTRQFCPHGDCAVDAIVAQFQALTRPTSTAAVKGSALRYLLHFIGDLHQPLHATTNGDRGGNCVPIIYYDRAPQQNPNGDYSPNLHAVWDSNTIRTLMTKRGLADARALARHIADLRPLPAAVAARPPTQAVVTQWAQGAHDLGRMLVYPRLPTPIAIEPASAAMLRSCTDNRNVAQRMLAKHEVVDDRYEQASIPAIVGQLRLAGIRLAATLNAAFPN